VPNIQEIYVHRNPFCKSYSNYRVTIFNLFRKTPGYTEDVVIDSTGPNSSERKQLVDRVPELPGVPVVKPPPEDEMPPPPVPPKTPVMQENDGATGKSDEGEPPLRRTSSHRHSKSGHGGSHRRKKGPKRRIVELSQSEIAHQSQEAAPVLPPSKPTFEGPVGAEATSTGDPAKSPPPIVQTSPVAPTVEASHPKLLPLNTDVAAQPASDPLASPPEFDVSSDMYKKKIEALRHDFGNSWLTALGDDSWDSRQVPNFPERDFNSAIRPPAPRTPSQGVVSGGRTLG